MLWDIYDDERMGGDCHRHRVHFPASTHHNGDDGDGGHKVVPVDLCPLDADQDLGAGQVEDGHFLVQTPSSGLDGRCRDLSRAAWCPQVTFTCA